VNAIANAQIIAKYRRETTLILTLLSILHQSVIHALMPEQHPVTVTIVRQCRKMLFYINIIYAHTLKSNAPRCKENLPNSAVEAM
jgi:hypothetical protein